MKTARELARQVAHDTVNSWAGGAECLKHDDLGWSHGFRCEELTDAFADAIEQRDTAIFQPAAPPGRREAHDMADHVAYVHLCEHADCKAETARATPIPQPAPAPDWKAASTLAALDHAVGAVPLCRSWCGSTIPPDQDPSMWLSAGTFRFCTVACRDGMKPRRPATPGDGRERP